MHSSCNGRCKKRQEEGVEMLPRNITDKAVPETSEYGVTGGYNVAAQDAVLGPARGETTVQQFSQGRVKGEVATVQAGADSDLNRQLYDVYVAATAGGPVNATGARVRVPSGLCIDAWARYLQDYSDTNLVDFLAYGWPINFDRNMPLQSTFVCHPSAKQHSTDIDFYIATEIACVALAGPFEGPPVTCFHASPLMTRPKKDTDKRRVIVDLSWPDGASVNDGISRQVYLDGPANTTLPTVDYMEGRILQLGPGAYLYKTDLARGYRQLRVDPADWPLLSVRHDDHWYMDICPPFGLCTSALFMQRTSEAISYIHGKAGFISRPYLDAFGGAEGSFGEAETAMQALQNIMRELGVQETVHKACGPTQQLIWLGLLYDTVAMTISIPPEKLQEIMALLKDWEGRVRASQGDMQSLIGTLQFVAGVSPPTRVFTNCMLQDLREALKRGTESLSWGFKRDLDFFLKLLPHFNGVRIMAKEDIVYQDTLELDACLTGCGACTGSQYYARPFPTRILHQQHSIARLELLNIVVALKVWKQQWSGRRVRVWSDNTNACCAVQTGRSRDCYIQDCVREIFLFTAVYDVELHVLHRPGVELTRADALSRAHTAQSFRRWIEADSVLQGATEVKVPDSYFDLDNEL